MKLMIRTAQDAWRLLNGVFCVYKPEGVSAYQVKKTIIANLCRDLNQLESRQPRGYVIIEGNVEHAQMQVKNVPNLADNPLVFGPRYQPQDFDATWAIYPGKFTSGVCVMGVNSGTQLCLKLRHANMLRVYQITGKFGIGTNTFHERGKILEKSTFDHITLHSLERQLSAIQTTHQKLMYSYLGLDPHSKETYEIASKGLIRPASDSQPLIYSIKCVRYIKPTFTIEINCINENEQYLMSLINDIGIAMKSTAVCSGIRQVRYGHFGVDIALLRKHWTLENIITNITECLPFTRKDMLRPHTPSLTTLGSHINQDKFSDANSDYNSIDRYCKNDLNIKN